MWFHFTLNSYCQGTGYSQFSSTVKVTRNLKCWKTFISTCFHSTLHNANEESPENGLVLLDARNLYETRIGKFHAPNVETLDPQVRQYSDFSSWIDDRTEQLKGKNILMYCTGGIRCEMASAYIKSKGAGFENVFQLFGGIQRYLEQFPDGVFFFKGKNFVLIIGYQLEVQRLVVQLVPVLFVNVPLTITLHVVDVLIAECLSWFVRIARTNLHCTFVSYAKKHKAIDKLLKFQKEIPKLELGQKQR